MPLITRRVALHALAALLSPLGAGTLHAARADDYARLEAEVGPLLRQLARLLFPHEAIKEDVYFNAAAAVVQDAVHDATLQEHLLNAPGFLDDAAGSIWIRLTDSYQAQAMHKLEDQPFFEHIRVKVRDHLYAQPGAWPALAYPGSSLEFGGYLDRGYDDIDWLPAEE